jgi:hypothetical protein
MTQKRAYQVTVAGFILVLEGLLFQTMGRMPAAIILTATVGGFIFWSLTSLKHPTPPSLLVPVYLLTILALWVHIGEEYAFDFGARIGKLVGSGWTNSEYTLSFVYIVPMLWILGAVGILFRHPLGYYMAAFIGCGMFLGEPTHLLVFPVREGGRYHYFPGMWTSLLPMVFGIWMLWLMLSHARRSGKVLP